MYDQLSHTPQPPGDNAGLPFTVCDVAAERCWHCQCQGVCLYRGPWCRPDSWHTAEAVMCMSALCSWLGAHDGARAHTMHHAPCTMHLQLELPLHHCPTMCVQEAQHLRPCYVTPDRLADGLRGTRDEAMHCAGQSCLLGSMPHMCAVLDGLATAVPACGVTGRLITVLPGFQQALVPWHHSRAHTAWLRCGLRRQEGRQHWAMRLDAAARLVL
jgi:hypothetical protein